MTLNDRFSLGCGMVMESKSASEGLEKLMDEANRNGSGERNGVKANRDVDVYLY